MLLVSRLVAKEETRAVVEAVVPEAGIFWHRERGLLPEYMVEVIAQSMAAASGYDHLERGTSTTGGFLVGLDTFTWSGTAIAGETLRVELEKTFQFEAVTVMHGRVVGRAGCLAEGSLKVWETQA